MSKPTRGNYLHNLSLLETMRLRAIAAQLNTAVSVAKASAK